ncbi:MAG: hypothetical protein IJ524_01830 [Bacteroidales bacterium]|nr:hypothetical protein [Bacteroidales bacterium]
MKKNDNTKSNLLVVAFFLAMTFGAAVASHAQDDPLASTPLVTTTGPNVLGSGHLMWSGDLSFYRLHSVWDEADYNNYSVFGAQTGLRWGIGSKAELTLGVSAEHAHGRVMDSLSFGANHLNLVPSLGARVVLLGGEGKKNMLTFVTEVTLPIRQGHPMVEDEGLLAEPIIGLQYRHRFSRHWYFDASAAYAWNRHAPYFLMTDRPFRLTLFARWLPNERWMFSAGLDGLRSRYEAMWQATDKLQLKAQVCVDGGKGSDYSAFSVYGLMGFNWMIR